MPLRGAIRNNGLVLIESVLARANLGAVDKFGGWRLRPLVHLFQISRLVAVWDGSNLNRFKMPLLLVLLGMNFKLSGWLHICSFDVCSFAGKTVY